MELTTRTLVTGGAGFIGLHLCERLLDAGHEVLCLDNFSTSRRENVAHLLDHPRFEMIRHDITRPIDLEVDRIYHLACPAAARRYQSNPIKTMKTAVLGSLHLLGLAKRVGARVLLASSGGVYGDAQADPISESYTGQVDPAGVRACHDEGKRAAETFFTDYQRWHGVDVRIARVFQTYGARMPFDDGRLFGTFLSHALQGEPLPIQGDGSQLRSFCHVDDMVEGLMRLMNYEGPGQHQPHNLGHPEGMTVADLANVIHEVLGKPPQVARRPRRVDDPQQRRPSIEMARRHLFWQPNVPIRVGIARTADDFRTRLGIDTSAARPRLAA